MQAWQATVQDEEGNIIFNPSITVYEDDGVNLANIYNEDGTTKDNPFIGTLEGFAQFWAEDGEYIVEGVNGADTTELWHIHLMTPVPNKVFASVSEMVADDRISSGDYVETLGYYSAGDSGANTYEIIGVSENAPQPSGNEPYLVLCSGQSNAVGLSGNSTDGVYPSNSGVYMWLATSDVADPAWVQNPNLQTTEYWVPVGLTARPTIGAGQNTLSLAFAHRLYEETGRDVYVVLDARGSQPITAWTGSGTSSTRYESLTIAVSAAMAEMPVAPPVAHFFLWQQGETDAVNGMDATTYRGHLDTLYSQLSAETWWHPTRTQFVSGLPSPTNSTYDMLREAIPAWVSDDSDMRKLASVYGVEIRPDNTHFTNGGLYVMGYNNYWNSVSVLGFPQDGVVINLDSGLFAKGLFPEGGVRPMQLGDLTDDKTAIVYSSPEAGSFVGFADPNTNLATGVVRVGGRGNSVESRGFAHFFRDQAGTTDNLIITANGTLRFRSHSEEPTGSPGDLARSDGTPSTNGFGIAGTGLYFNTGFRWYMVDGSNVASVASPTISGGSISAPRKQEICRVATEGGAATDNLDNIFDGYEGQKLLLTPATSNEIVVVRSGVGNIMLNNGEDVTLTLRRDSVYIYWLDNAWREMGR